LHKAKARDVSVVRVIESFEQGAMGVPDLSSTHSVQQTVKIRGQIVSATLVIADIMNVTNLQSVNGDPSNIHNYWTAAKQTQFGLIIIDLVQGLSKVSWDLRAV
jgi:hypothetical protein